MKSEEQRKMNVSIHPEEGQGGKERENEKDEKVNEEKEKAR